MRRRRAEKHERKPDLIYNDRMVGLFVNILMLEGKKTKAERIIYGAFDKAQGKLNKEPLEIFYQALDNIRPQVEVKPRRIGGATYQIPMEVSRERGFGIAMRWLRDIVRGKKGKSMVDKLSDELISAFNGEGIAIKKRDDTHRMAEANKAFAHFRR